VPSNGADEEGKPDFQEKAAEELTVVARANTETEEQPTPASAPQNVAAIDPAPPIPVSNPRRDAQRSETVTHTSQGRTASRRASSRRRYRSSYRRRTRPSRREVIVYRRGVRAYLAANKPNGGQGKGTVRVAFILSSTGRVLAAHVTHSSGKRVLDQAALRAVHSASPFPHPPKGIRTSRLRFSIPFYFQ
jgi:protein TonB